MYNLAFWLQIPTDEIFFFDIWLELLIIIIEYLAEFKLINMISSCILHCLATFFLPATCGLQSVSFS